MGDISSRALSSLLHHNDPDPMNDDGPIMGFPNEILKMIFAYLGIHDWKNIRQVCKKWCNVVDRTHMKFRIRINELTDLKAVQTFCAEGLHVNKLIPELFLFPYPEEGFGFTSVKHLKLSAPRLGGQAMEERWGTYVHNISRLMGEMENAQLSSLTLTQPERIIGKESGFTSMNLQKLSSLQIYDEDRTCSWRSTTLLIVSDAISVFSNTFPNLRDVSVELSWALSALNPTEGPAKCLVSFLKFIGRHHKTLKDLYMSLSLWGNWDWDLDETLFISEPIPLSEYQEIKDQLELLHLNSLLCSHLDPFYVPVQQLGRIDLAFEICKSQQSLKVLEYYCEMSPISIPSSLNKITSMIRKNEKTLTKLQLHFEEPRDWDIIGNLTNPHEFTCATFQHCNELRCLTIVDFVRQRRSMKMTKIPRLPNSIQKLKLECFCKDVVDFVIQGTLPGLEFLSICLDEYADLLSLTSGGMLPQIIRINSKLRELRVHSVHFRRSDDVTALLVMLWSDMLRRNGWNEAIVEDYGYIRISIRL